MVFVVGGRLAEDYALPSNLVGCVFHFRSDDPPMFIERANGTLTVTMRDMVVIPAEQLLDGKIRGKLVRSLRRARKA